MIDDGFITDFERDGYYLFRGLFSADEVEGISKVIHPAHARWLEMNREHAVVNSNYLTSSRYMPDDQNRLVAFRFIASEKLRRIAAKLCPRGVYFLNTQLFFNPADVNRKPYWHRDVQYLGVDEAKQQDIILKDTVLHFRIPLSDDPGLDFVPGSHRRWDSALERVVRLEKDGHKNSEDLPEMVRIAHRLGDLLVFSAHLIHRGSYGLDRRSFDVIYTDFPEQAKMAASFEHFPNEHELALFEHSEIFRTV